MMLGENVKIWLFLEVAVLKLFIKTFPLLKGAETMISEGNILPGTLYMQPGWRQIYNYTVSSVTEHLHFTLVAGGYSWSPEENLLLLNFSNSITWFWATWVRCQEKQCPPVGMLDLTLLYMGEFYQYPSLSPQRHQSTKMGEKRQNSGCTQIIWKSQSFLKLRIY